MTIEDTDHVSGDYDTSECECDCWECRNGRHKSCSRDCSLGECDTCGNTRQRSPHYVGHGRTRLLCEGCIAQTEEQPPDPEDAAWFDGSNSEFPTYPMEALEQKTGRNKTSGDFARGPQ